MSENPRLECMAPGCSRGTRRYPSGEFICAKHWRTVPQSWKRRMTLFRRKRFAAEKRGDADRSRRLSNLELDLWFRIRRHIIGAELEGDDLPPGLEGHLRDLALI